MAKKMVSVISKETGMEAMCDFSNTMKKELSSLLFSDDLGLVGEEDENGKVLLFREFQLVNGTKTDKGESHSVKVSGKFLAPCVRTQELLQAGKRAGFALALQLLSFESDKVYEALGFKTTANMCFAMFGIDKATTNNYIAVARKMGKMHRVTEFPIGHLVRLLTAFREKDNVCKNPLEMLNNAIDEMIITPYMSQSELAEKAKILVTKGSFVVDTKTDDTKTDDSRTDDTKTDDTKTDDTKTDDTKTDDTKTDDTKTDDTKTENVDIKSLASNTYRAISMIIGEVKPNDDELKALLVVQEYLKRAFN